MDDSLVDPQWLEFLRRRVKEHDEYAASAQQRAEEWRTELRNYEESIKRAERNREMAAIRAEVAERQRIEYEAKRQQFLANGTWLAYDSDGTRKAVYDRDGGVCQWCGTEVQLKGDIRYAPSLDHIIPRSKGGSDDIDNLRLLHVSCNSTRGASDQLVAKR